MVIQLDTNFTEIELKKGVVQNLSEYSDIEFNTSDSGIPPINEGIYLKPSEILPFSLDSATSAYIRMASINSTNATNAASIEANNNGGYLIQEESL